MAREPAHPSKQVPGAPAPKRTDRTTPPRPEPAFRTSPGASVNKRSVSREPAFKTRPGPGSDV